MASPSKISKINHPEADTMHDRLQLLAYKCYDPTMNPRDTAQQLCTLATELMTIMSRGHKQRIALQSTITTLREELERTKTQLAEAKVTAELLAATTVLCKDDLNDSSTQTHEPSSENADLQSAEKDFCKDDLHDEDEDA